MKFIPLFLVLFISTSLFAQSPYILTGIKAFYPVVEINSAKIDKKYKQEILDLIKEQAKIHDINTKNYSTTSLAVLINYVSVGDTIALKVVLVVGEEVMRKETKEDVFALTYNASKLFVVENIDEDLMDNVEDLLDAFFEQYKEDNE